MTEEKRKRNREAIRAIEARFEFLRLSRGTNPPMFASKGLVSLATVLDLLARRHLDEVASGMVIRACLEASRLKAVRQGTDEPFAVLSEEEKPDARLLAPYGRYIGYCQRFMELSRDAQHAVRSGEMVIRSSETGAKLRNVDGWLSQTFDEGRTVRLPSDCAYWQITSSDWPDCLALPPGGLTIADAEAWAVSSGVARPGELLALLGIEDPDLVAQPSGTVLSLVRGDRPAPHPSDDWTPERLAKRKAELIANGVRDHNKRLVVESGLNGRDIRREIERFNKGGAMASIAGQLRK